LEKGLEKGQVAMATKVLVRLLQRQFEEVPEEVRARLQTLSASQLERLIDVALSAESLAAFVDRLPKARSVKPEA
jgi:ABC-type sulfate transport system permease component